jgi:cell filamentation protein
MAANRCDVSGLLEAQFEPESCGRVLRNLRGITRKREMDRVEAQAQLGALEQLFGEFGPDHRFNAADIGYIHRLWLETIYGWAGNYRQVNASGISASRLLRGKKRKTAR